MVEEKLVRTKLKELRSYLNQLDKYQEITVEELENNLEQRWVIERGLQLSIQLVLDIGNHILSEEGITVNNYTGILKELGELEVIPPEFAKKIKGMAGFRNVLVHDYMEVDLELLVRVINNSLKDFKKFAQYILDYLNNN
ncbi:hypothetical protein Halha_2371 [Halobacteroides halobius DSM 5150]|uniref:DUF86 domain-containing protein n=1 Tax=Halobacteroides halobius (strain ATCC 35273 / DSM 5150 / MD-1) TaxID=748449 RepID=L0KCG9_HALHC|nr:DUF86 domain-containing protein [Halobacteroides halobius]AGB42245.1 hypothetical protein Halha_2371 [Halobacteroides halobius DSM 5150]